MSKKRIDAVGPHLFLLTLANFSIKLEQDSCNRHGKTFGANDPAQDDISHWVVKSGHELLGVEKQDGGVIEFSIKKVK